jgi:uncharacterized protein (DUF305 family)
MAPPRLGGITALLAAMALLPCSAATLAAQTTMQSSANAPGEAAAIARARADSARLPYVAADIDFMTGMIGHHAQAILISRWAATHGASPQVQTLASRIINSQQDEIHTMQQWLRDRQQPVPDGNPGSMKMDGSGMAMPMGDMKGEPIMPGMLSDAQLKVLDAARGPEFDRLFLRDMIQHHEGALTMVTKLFNSYGAGQDEAVFKFATDANVDQTTEIARMQKMLVAMLFGADSQ